MNVQTLKGPHGEIKTWFFNALARRLHRRCMSFTVENQVSEKTDKVRFVQIQLENKTNYASLLTKSWERWTRRKLPFLLPAIEVCTCWHHIFGLKGAQAVNSTQMNLDCLKGHSPAILQIKFHL